MAAYRDELEAMAKRTAALEQDLAAKQREVDALQGNGSREERLERLARDLAAAQAELASLRKPPRRISPMMTAVGSGMVALVTTGCVVFIIALARRPASVPRPIVQAPVLPRLPAEPVGPAPAPPPTTRVTPPAPRADVSELETTWKARVKSVHGSDLAVGTACDVRATLGAIRRDPDRDFMAMSGTDEVHKLAVVCGKVPLYSTLDRFSGESSNGSAVYEVPTSEGGFRRALAYEDQGERSGRNDITLDTLRGVARIWTGGVEVSLSVDELDAATPGPVFSSDDVEGCSRARREGAVTSSSGSGGVGSGAACVVFERPRSSRCQVRVTCGGKALYADGHADSHDGKVVDDKPTSQDQDPKLEIAGDDVTVSDEGLKNWSVKIRLKPQREPAARPTLPFIPSAL